MSQAVHGPPRLTVVVVTWNARDLVTEALDGLQRQDLDRRLWDVLVVDNASVDGTAEVVGRHPVGATVLRSGSNLGFAGGAHLGIAEVTTPYVVLLNNDAVPEPGFLSALLAAAEAPGADDVAAVTAKVLLMPRFRQLADPASADVARGDVTGPDGSFTPDPDGTVDVINSTGNVVDRWGYGRDRSWGRADHAVDDPVDVFAFCGAAALLRRDALRQVGDFDPDLFLYYEDTDLSWRLRRAGWRITYEGSAVVRHRHGASSDFRSEFFRFYDDRNRLLVLAKNAPPSTAIRAALRHPLTIGSLLVHEGPRAGMTRARVRAYWSFLRLAPRMLRRRRQPATRAAAGSAGPTSP